MASAGVFSLMAGLAAAALLASGTLAALAWALFHPKAQVFARCVWHGPRDRPLVALTFDDGPHPEVTRRVMAVLEAHGARATFFVVGREVERAADVARELVARGHELGNHTYSHGMTLDLLSGRRLLEDVERCQRAIEVAVGVPARWYRPSVGVRNGAVRSAARAAHLPVVTWGLGARDGVRRFSKSRAEAMAKRARPGDILALHDGVRPGQESLRAHTVENLTVLLAGLTRRGLRVVTLSELLGPKAP